LPIHEIHTFLERHDLKSRAIPKPEKIDQINSLLTEFYEVCGKEEQTNKRCEYLIEEIGNIRDLVERFDLIKHLDHADDEYTEEGVKELKKLIADLSQEILACQNLQNRNKF
jgi:CHAD domain-containing protein